MACKRCQDDPQPEGFGSPRRCAFTEDGEFTPDNWNCATIGALYEVGEMRIERLYGNDESMDVFDVLDQDDPVTTRGWWVVTRYKSRGCTSSIAHVGDFYPPEPVTLAAVEAELAWRIPRPTPEA